MQRKTQQQKTQQYKTQCFKIEAEDEAVGRIRVPGTKGRGVTVIGTEAIRNGFDETCLKQAINCVTAPGVTDVVLNPDGHAGYGAPIGCVMVSPTHIYPGPVGVDIKCSMSLLQLNIPEAEILDKRLRRELINAISDRIPTGAGKGQRQAPKSRIIEAAVARRVVTEGASREVCKAMGIPTEWIARCEDAVHFGQGKDSQVLEERLDRLLRNKQLERFEEKLSQLGSYGGGNHFGECNIVDLDPTPRMENVADVFGLKHGCASFLSHCGSRGFGYQLANNQFRYLQDKFRQKGTAFPGDDKELVYAPLGSNDANDYLSDMSLGGNFATLNHLLINSLVLEAFQEVLPGTEGNLVYFISHNIARFEKVGGAAAWVHRKGATRAFPAGHAELRSTIFENTGHPILLPGNPKAGSAVMVANPDAVKSCYSVNHGAGRAMGRKAAIRALDQAAVDAEFSELDILTNCRKYPLDESPAAYKDFKEVLASVEKAGLASKVATLRAKFVIKDGDSSLRGAA